MRWENLDGDLQNHLNDQRREVTVDRTDMPLLWVLRDVLVLTGIM
jgi:aerobic-type carbon monoxide dehydrogenase small subunit (CoxS/CutS family)